jgi:hypothetical protein
MISHAFRLLVLVLVVAAAAVAAATARADSTVAAAPPPAQTADPCTLFSFSTGPTDVNVAGLVTVHLDPIGANVEVSGLLGTLLCPLLGGSSGATVPAA